WRQLLRHGRATVRDARSSSSSAKALARGGLGRAGRESSFVSRPASLSFSFLFLFIFLPPLRPGALKRERERERLRERERPRETLRERGKRKTPTTPAGRAVDPTRVSLNVPLSYVRADQHVAERSGEAVLGVCRKP